MATEAPDPRTFKSWEDAFQFPIPVVRKLENQLRSNANENREKLRSLVGASYRSHLDTAETIIDMEIRMEQVESKLARVGQNCNTRGLDRISSNAMKMDTHNRARDVARYTFASQLSVLRNCPVVMARLLKEDGSYLLIAKILVISRLLYKALSQSKNASPVVDQLWERVSSVRRKCLRRIDKRLASATGDISMLVESMCAYSLATSSTPTNVLEHFHRVRREAILKNLKNGHDLATHGVQSLRLCLQTCQDTQAIFPRRLAESLARLKSQPLVQDPDVRSLYELNLDIHDRWVGDEARNYTPWPRHDELQRPEAEKILHKWSKEAISAFLQGIKAALNQEERLKEVSSLRQELIETWILSGSGMAGVKSARILDDLRDTMNNQLETIVSSRTQSLQSVVSDLTQVLSKWSSGGDVGNASLWTTASTSTDLGNGAQSFKSSILNTYQGRDEAVIHVVSTFDKWMESVLEVKGIVKSMKETRWDDTFADDVDDSDDEFGLDSKQSLLSDDDPRLLEEVTQEALGEALNSLGKSFAQIVSKLTLGHNDGSIPQSIFILRVVREIGDRIPRLRLQDKYTPPPTPFSSDVLRLLHSALGRQIVHPAVKAYKKSLATAGKSRSQSHILWEGNPALPAQPSPSAFRFLQGLVRNMGALGSDLWAPDGVSVFKAMTCEEVSKIWQENFEAITKPDPDDVEQAQDTTEDVPESEATIETKDPPSTKLAPEAEDRRSEKLKQLLFDILYVQRYLGGNARDVVEALYAALEVDGSIKARLNRNAADYGRKTYLLFALLA
ncbi:hypothetical protein K505DRAFT_298672 [Melanomma pulvis-pyrius CBS 109.77]|uniref:Conserved oligomeric Golgi complex subunit 1 n=1 Tax=Melanomma pulvis-pyrius CBS 109.77 TaxID=1314802 RepID=A0A6A6XLA7_9PLEO|nr:hypothetical protein K505DRAFT_298672 [Melanomma pulvis-pyrius CBS 109.77]